MNLELVFWDWSGTLISDAIKLYPNLNLIKNKYACNFLGKRYGFVKYAWFLVEKFLSHNIKQIIVTNGTKQGVLRYLIFNPFDMILTAEEYLAKPNIEMLEYACSYYNIENKKNIIFIGDSVSDQLTADNFGINFFKMNDYFNDSRKILEVYF